jgi:hypothetical protein
MPDKPANPKPPALASPREGLDDDDDRLENLLSQLEEGIQDTDSGMLLLGDNAASLIRAYVKAEAAQSLEALSRREQQLRELVEKVKGWREHSEQQAAKQMRGPGAARYQPGREAEAKTLNVVLHELSALLGDREKT